MIQKITQFSMLLLLFISSVTSAANSAIIVNVDNTESDIKIALPANPTTGYQWTVVSYDRALLQLVSNNYERPTTTRMGAGGTMVYHFHVINRQNVPKMTTLIFKYAQPWQPEKATMQTVTINFQTGAAVKHVD